ncbi:MAG: ATP-binding cassette domain-containing protein, partial [Bacteroidota bacterium]
IDLKIPQGAFYGLLGPNSAGKTTLISILCGLLKITSGKVILNGIDVEKHPEQIKKSIGLIPQEIALYHNLTINENLKFFGQMQGIFGKELKLRIDECLEVVKLQTHANKLVSKCSGGIKRRTNLIAGLIHQPQIIFLDEPTLGVDAQSRTLIFEYLQVLNSNGATLIYTTHYMREAETLCSWVNIIDNGRIIVQGTPKDLIANQPNCTDLGQVFISLTGRDLRD